MLQVGLVAGAVAADPWFSYGYPRFERVCEGIRNAGECAARIETSQLASNRNAVERVPKGIHIRTRSGGLVELKDGPPGVSGWSYFYRELRSESYSHVIFIGRYEGTSWMLVDAESGHRTALQAPPIVSPDHQRFVTISMDLDASYNPNSVRIWVMAAGAPRLEWELSP